MSFRVRLLRLLVRCHPPAFRRRFGGELEALLGDLLGDLRTGRRTATARIAADLLASAAAEWWSALARPATGDAPAVPGWPRLRWASPQRTAGPPGPPFTPLPSLRRRHGGELPLRAPTMR